MINKKGEGFGILHILFIIVILIISYLFYTGFIDVMNKDCAEEIAKNYCESKRLIFGEEYARNVYGFEFSCFDDERSVDEVFFKYTEEEIKKCK